MKVSRTTLFSVAVLLLPAAIVSGMPSAAEASSPAFTLTVTVQDAAGNPVANAAATLSQVATSPPSLWHFQSRPVTALTQSTTSSTGVLELSPSSEAIARNGSNPVELQLYVDASASAPTGPPTPGQGPDPLLFTFTAVPRVLFAGFEPSVPDGSTLRVGVGVVQQGFLSTSPAARSDDLDGIDDPIGIPAGVNATIIQAPSSENQAGQEQVTNPAAKADVSGMVPSDSSATKCPTGYTKTNWWGTSSYAYPYVPDKIFRTTSRASFQWSITRTHETKLEIAAQVGGDWARAGFSGAAINSSSLNYAPTSQGLHKKQIWLWKWTYQKQQLVCFSTDPYNNSYVRLDVYRWYPYQQSVGNIYQDTKAVPPCGGTSPAYTATVQSPVSISEGSTATYKGFFSIQGVSLSTSQTDGSHQTFTVTPERDQTGAYKAARICGSDGEPTHATFVREMFY